MTSFNALTEPADAKSFEQLAAIASTFARRIGCDYFSYLTTRFPGGDKDGSDILATDYPEEWIKRYMERNYRFYDPVVTIARTARLPYYWGERGFLKPYRKAERHVFHEAGEYRILEGYAIPTAGPEGDSGIFSVNMTQRNQIHDLVRDETARLQLFAAQFHDAAVRLGQKQGARTNADLSKREKEVLSWTSNGLSSEAVAGRIGLTASAVNYHLGNAARKLGAANKIQAVALSIRYGLI
jgi:DNA-binding CsgD family transcriptional regulator